MRRPSAGIFAILLAACSSLAAQPVQASDARCISAIHRAVAAAKPDLVPQACWHIGPVALLMQRADVEKLLGPPDHADALSDPALGPVVAYYVYPRDLPKRLAKNPVPVEELRVTHMAVVYQAGWVSSIYVGEAAAIYRGKCQVSTAAFNFRPFLPSRFPYRFASLALGNSIAKMRRTLGPFTWRNRSHDYYNYSPVPIAVDGEKKIDAIEIAVDNSLPNKGALLSLTATFDPKTCLVDGYSFGGANP